jgi:hypothetical protein
MPDFSIAGGTARASTPLLEMDQGWFFEFKCNSGLGSVLTNVDQWGGFVTHAAPNVENDGFTPEAHVWCGLKCGFGTNVLKILTTGVNSGANPCAGVGCTVPVTPNDVLGVRLEALGAASVWMNGFKLFQCDTLPPTAFPLNVAGHIPWFNGQLEDTFLTQLPLLTVG